ncbi:PREDICTED: uncharacterized protein LOC18597852 [Theobroma cacao]|uniref:Uncharacterized protein LOC18597852 n=2 Tax=Theobroma cacao TaxID=3641 RepID=A0AB32WDT1_THECC|nr:PREDICTED: uncharacterized protein LOC18597852 [Theobroma cacao]EOY07656.1 Uncharacterized protein TCM_022040 [Theobroma cacao]
MSNITTLPRLGLVSSAHRPGKKGQKTTPKTKPSKSTMGFSAGRKELWRCVENCGACCKLAKGPAFATPEEIFSDPSDIELYRSLIGPDGWCIHYEKATRTCSIYSERPYFCRVEPDIFKKLYGIENKKFNKEACSCCRDTIKAIYGPHSKELDNFNRSVKGSGSS